MRSTSASFVLVGVIAAIASCAEAGGEVRGGDLTDAGQLATNPPAFTPDTGAPEGGTRYECVGTGTTWTALYDDIFGPTERPGSCSFQSSCHGSPDAAGAKVGSGIKCFDAKGCRQSFLDQGLVTPADAEAPENSMLLTSLLRVKKPDGKIVGFMPQQPADYVFPDACVERIQTWIRNGAKDD